MRGKVQVAPPFRLYQADVQQIDDGIAGALTNSCSVRSHHFFDG